MPITTVQVDTSTVQMLKQLRYKTQASSYNEVILGLVRAAGRQSLYGFLPKRLSKKQILSGLRDESDRM